MQDRADAAAVRAPAWACLIAARRHELGLRQDELAAVAGVATRSVHAIESGKATIRLDVLAAVCAALGLRIELRGPGDGGTLERIGLSNR